MGLSAMWNRRLDLCLLIWNRWVLRGHRLLRYAKISLSIVITVTTTINEPCVSSNQSPLYLKCSNHLLHLDCFGVSDSWLPIVVGGRLFGSFLPVHRHPLKCFEWGNFWTLLDGNLRLRQCLRIVITGKEHIIDGCSNPLLEQYTITWFEQVRRLWNFLVNLIYMRERELVGGVLLYPPLFPFSSQIF